MARFTIYSKDGQIRRHEGEPQYSGSYMGVDFVEFRTISSPTPIDWQIGDYVDYYRTGKRYKLYSLPMPKKVARKGEYGASFEYSNVQLYGATKELEIAPFRDLVSKDNKIHFSTRPEVSTYEDVYGIARRIQECMDDIFPNRWRIEVYDTDDADLLALMGETKEYSVSNGSCLDALSQIYDTWKNVGWIHTYDSTNEIDIITIGRANVRDAENTSDAFVYGIGKGLTSLKKASANEGEFATRLYVYGSERNIQTRYYNGLEILNKDSVDIRNLMLPIEKWGKTDGLPDARKAYLQADDSIIEKYGLIPRTVYFDGNGNEEIYPSITGLTMAQVRQAMIDAGQGDSEFLPGNYDYRIDEIGLLLSPLDSGSKEDTEANMTFVVGLREMGLDIAEQGKLTNEGYATISMKSGACAGREFKVKKYYGPAYGNESDGRRTYLVERNWDDSIGMGFPNKTYPINAGDKFVILDVPMPDFYLTLAAKDLLEAGEKKLADYTRVSAFYEPSVDAIKIKAGGKLLHAGMFMQVYDEDIIDTADNKDYVLIDTLTIDEKSDLPIYKVTLREQKRSARTYSVLEDMIEDAKEVSRQDIRRERQYTERRFRSAQETLKLLQAAFTNFSEGISPVTVRTMGLLLGDESLQFKFTESRDSLESIPCPVVYDNTTRKFKATEASLIHMTLGIDAVTSAGTRTASDYKSWDLPEWESEFLEDTEARYLYVRASKTDASAEYVMSAEPIAMDSVDGYHFLVGILNSEYNGSRDFVTLYGFTEILPGQITTDVIRSADGNTYFDLAKSVIGGKIVFTSGSSGLKNLSEWSGVEETINSKANQEDLDDFESAVTGEFKNLQDQIDGSITTWFQKGVPTLNNYPAVDWNTDTLQQHVGDLYYDEDTGKAYRFQYNSTSKEYEWTKITDEAITEALALAGQAQDTADGKRRVFTDPPTKDDAYDVGDLWVNATYGTTYSNDLLRCKTAKSEGTAFSINHWERASKYTDDTAANAAASAAQAALDAANAASGEAKEATGAVDNLVNTTLPALRDGVITESEKIAIEKYINIVNKEFADVTAAYEELSINSLLPSAEKTGLANAYNTLKAAKDALLAAINGAILEEHTHTSKDVDTAYETYRQKSASYSAAVEDAYYAIENTIDGTAKAAKKATEDLNDDLILTLTEKRSLRRSLKEINPSEGQHPVAQYYDITKRENLESAYPWTLVNDTSDPYFGWYETSDSQVDKHSSYSRTKIHLRIYYPCDVRVFIASEAESTYDFVLLSPLDTELLASNFADSNAVATTKGNQSSKVISHTFAFTQAMLDKKKDYFITIKYKKDSSDSTSAIATDKGYYRIDTYPGSLNDYIRICGEKGLPKATFMTAIEAAEDLFYFLANDHDLWDDDNTELEEIVNAEGKGTGKTNFRNEVYSYFQEYYAAIANLVQVTSMSDLQYLSNAFKDSKGVIDGGLMLGSFIGVGDTVVDDEDNIVVKAAMNGSSLGSDTEHGKLMLALGIPDPDTGSADKEGDFEDRLSEATTRIYEDGTIITDSLDAKGKVESSYAIFRDYIVYKYSKIQDVCNSGTISSDYTLPAKAPTYILFDAQEHSSKEPVLRLPSTYEEGRTITIACTPIISKSDANLTLSGTMYLAANTTSEGLNPSVSSLVLPGGKVELLRAKNTWIVLTRISE